MHLFTLSTVLFRSGLTRLSPPPYPRWSADEAVYTVAANSHFFFDEEVARLPPVSPVWGKVLIHENDRPRIFATRSMNLPAAEFVRQSIDTMRAVAETRLAYITEEEGILAHLSPLEIQQLLTLRPLLRSGLQNKLDQALGRHRRIDAQLVDLAGRIYAEIGDGRMSAETAVEKFVFENSVPQLRK